VFFIILYKLVLPLDAVTYRQMDEQVGVLQNLLLKHAYKYQIIYPIGTNFSVFHQSCPPLIQQYRTVKVLSPDLALQGC